MSPAKIAMAVAVTMAAIAGSGDMKNVTGTSSAVAMVAVRPGMAPTNSPKAPAQNMTRRLYGSKTSLERRARACSPDDPGKRTKRQTAPAGSGGRSSRSPGRPPGAGKGDSEPPATKACHEPPGQQGRGDQEADAVPDRDQRHEPADHQPDVGQVAATPGPLARGDDTMANSGRRSPVDKSTPPQTHKPMAIMCGNSAGPKSWPGIAGKPSRQ